MRNLNNLDEMLCVLADAEKPVRAILADDEVKKLWRGGSYLDVMFYLIRRHREALFGVIAALDGEVTAEEAAGKYSLTDAIRLFSGVIHSEELREVFVLFSAAEKKKSAVSSGSAPGNTVG